jgi:hypothetical protein
MYCNVLNQSHIMFGADFHGVPMIVGAPLQAGIWGWIKGQSVPTILVDGENAVMTFGTDIGYGIPHVGIAPPLLLLACTAFSGSKSEFAAFRVRVGDEQKPIAIAFWGSMGLNLNCGDSPTPSGFVLAFGTVQAWRSGADLAASFFALATDLVVGATINRFIKLPWAKTDEMDAAVARALLGKVPGVENQTVKEAFGSAATIPVVLDTPVGALSGSFVEAVADQIAGYYENPEIVDLAPADESP